MGTDYQLLNIFAMLLERFTGEVLMVINLLGKVADAVARMRSEKTHCKMF